MVAGDSNDANPFDELELTGGTFGLAVLEISRTSLDSWPVFDRPEFSRPTAPWPRPISDFVPRCRPSSRPRQRGISPRRNRARSRVGRKWAARRAA